MGISVLLSVYKKENPKYFAQALESVMHQTLQPDEIVIIKDGPLTDELEQVIDEAKETFANIVTFQFEENVQLGRALEKGVQLCKNELIARMDTDDIACPERLQVQFKYMRQHPEVAVCGGWLEEFNDEGTHKKIKEMPIEKDAIRKYARYRNPLNHMTVMFRKSEIIKAGNYKHFPLLEDYYLWCRVIANGGVVSNLPRVLVNMRTNEGIYGRRGGWKYFKQYIQLRKEQRKMGLLSVSEYIVAIVLTMGMTLQPSFLRKMVYQKVLRK